MRRTTRLLTLTCAAAAAMFAQQGRLAGPVTGYIFDPAIRGIRPVLGVPGASVLGDKAELRFDSRSAVVSPRLDGAIAFSTEGGVKFLRIDDGVFSEVATAGLDGGAQMAVFSPSGTAAALLSNQTVQVVTGLPGSPKLRSTLSLGSPVGRPARGMTRDSAVRHASMAVTDEGDFVLLGGEASVRLLGSDGADRELTDAESGLVAFAAGGRDAAVLDARNGLVLIKDVGAAATRKVLAPKEAVGSASGLAFSADGSRVMVASLNDHAVLTFQADSGERQSVACSCAPSKMERMGRVFRLNEAGNGPLWLLDVAADGPRTVFVPAQ